ncbi:fatty acyl-CoA reductase [Ideonella sp. BN130291]|uniref:fatty acyl-CoA reductase n=1 Tax=Ideonella sp. BN130291 TaxID=3112940 RepID=UPI002E26A4EA|nr:fatty acyl-CoA reductase [Ideonella sp. BN130291]
MNWSVATALAGKRVLITGTTGFIGKVVLEKLVRDVPGIARMVLVLRGSRQHADALQRLRAEVLSSSVFDHLRCTAAARLQRFVDEQLQVVDGSLTEPQLGLEAEAFARLASEVDVIVNIAASVNFREALDQALAINTFSVRHLAELARAAGGIPLVQVSTCYVNGHRRGLIAETLAPGVRTRLAAQPDGSSDVQGLLAQLQQQVAQLKQRVPAGPAQERALVDLGIRQARRLGWNDTYTFTKWLGEQVARHEMRGGTLSIVRPAIVESACHEPQPGWIEGMKVGDAIVLAYARGKTRLFPARPAGVADIIPVDLVANSIVLATAEALQHPGACRIYQAASGARNPVRVGEYVRLCQTEMRSNAAAYPRLIRRPLDKPFRTVPRPLFLAGLGIAVAFAGLAHRVARAFGLPAQRLAFYDAINTTRELATVFSFYTSPRYVFDNRELLALAQRFEPADRQRFEVDPLCFDWAHYVARIHLPGLERYAVKSAPTEGARAAPEAAAALPGATAQLPGSAS